MSYSIKEIKQLVEIVIEKGICQLQVPGVSVTNSQENLSELSFKRSLTQSLSAEGPSSEQGDDEWPDNIAFYSSGGG